MKDNLSFVNLNTFENVSVASQNDVGSGVNGGMCHFKLIHGN